MDEADKQEKVFGKLATLAEYCELVTDTEDEAAELFARMVDGLAPVE